MPTTDPVKVPIIGEDKVTPIVKKATMSLRDMGEKVSKLGMRMTAAFTLPIVLAGKSILSFGAESSKTLADLKKDFADAYASNDPAKLKAAGDAWRALSPSVFEAGKAYDQLQAALKPINVEFDKTKAVLLTALVPVLKDLTPTLLSIARGVADVAKQFSLLPQWQQTAIISTIGLVAVMGPMVVVIGQIIGLSGGIGTMASALKGFGIAAYAALGPVGALIIAVTTLIGLINGGQAAQAWTTLQQLALIGLRPFVGDQGFMRGAQNMGLTAAPAGAGGGGTTFNYINNGISTANQDEAARMLAKLQPAVQRQQGR